ncbi:MAG: Gfo/Idh/MocA family oxidoreductase, partial [Limibaculum sp.]
MNLFAKLQAQAASGRPVRAGLIGAGKFGSMFLSQVPTTPGLEVTVIADLAPERARSAMATVGWDAERTARTAIITSGEELAARDDVDVVIDATGHPEAGILHA